MIHITEALVDPVAFFRAHSELSRSVDDDHGLIVAGPDIDMLITRSARNNKEREEEVHVSETNLFLGELYLEGLAKSVSDKLGSVDIAWYPSPQFVNELSESLGRRVGQDVLRFVHSETAGGSGRIPPAAFNAHFARKEFPQSFKKPLFHHDRKNDHAPGALLMSAAHTKQIALFADGALSANRGAAKPRKQKKSITNMLDSMTATMTDYVDLLTSESGQLIEEGEIPLAIASRHRAKLGDYRGLYDISVLPRDKREQNDVKNAGLPMQRLGFAIHDHLLSLVPAIDRVKQERGLVNNTVVSEHPSSVRVVDS